jgi:hypothetical protein
MDPMGTIADLSRATWRTSSYSGGEGTNCVEVTCVPLWRKSSFSGGNGSNCVEVAQVPTWRKSSFSSGNGSECVEVGDAGQAIAVRDSKDPDGPSLLVSPAAWADLTARIKSGRLS